jgi:prephenate dehydrogenase
MNLVAKRLAQEVVGVGRDPKNLLEAVRRRAIDRAGALQELCLLKDGDLVVLATPVRTIRDLLGKMPRGPLIVDVGSTKSAILAEASRRRLRFVGCHPIAGTEVPGAAGAQKNLFRGKVCIVTPVSGTRGEDLSRARRLWKHLGSTVILMSPKAHDRLLARFSHLPHVLAYALMATPVADKPRGIFAGLGSFRSATRVAGSEPAMWRDILLENRDNVLPVLDGFTRNLEILKGLLTRRDAAGLHRYLLRARARRLKIP